MKVIVIGGSGYVGSNIATHIEAEKVTYYSRSKNSQLEKKGIEWIQGDILDSEKILEAVKDYDMVIDAAGIGDESEQKFFDVHITGVKNIVAALQKYDTDQRLVYFSTVNTHYGGTEFFRTKGIGEDNAAMVKNHLNVRPSVIFGNGDPFTQKLFNLAKQKVSKLPQGGSLSPVHIEDVVRIIERAKDLNGAVDVSSRDRISFAEAINLAFEKLGDKPRMISEGKSAISSAAEAIKGTKIFTDSEVDRYLMNHYKENTYIDRFIKEPISFRDYIKSYKPE